MQVDDLDPPEIRPHTSPPLPPTSPPLPLSSPPPPSSSPRPPSPPPPPTPPSSDPPQDSDPGPNFGLDTPVGDEYPPATLLKICNSLEFIQMVKDTTLASQFEPEELAELLEPREHVSMPPDDPVLKLSLLNFVSFMGHSQSAYEEACWNLQECFPDIELLSYYQAEQCVRDYSGVITWEHHMCSRSCVGFTSPFADLEQSLGAKGHLPSGYSVSLLWVLKQFARQIPTQIPSGYFVKEPPDFIHKIPTNVPSGHIVNKPSDHF